MLIWLRICAPLTNQGSCEHCLSLSLSFSDLLCLKVSKTQAGYVFGEKNKLLPASHFLCSHYFRPPNVSVSSSDHVFSFYEWVTAELYLLDR